MTRWFLLPTNETAFCSGDSGGPVYCKGYSINGKREYVLAGVISATLNKDNETECDLGIMGVADVSDDLEFIMKAIEVREITSAINSGFRKKIFKYMF